MAKIFRGNIFDALQEFLDISKLIHSGIRTVQRFLICQKKAVSQKIDPFGRERARILTEQEDIVDWDKLYYLEHLYLMVMISMKSFLDN